MHLYLATIEKLHYNPIKHKLVPIRRIVSPASQDIHKASDFQIQSAVRRSLCRPTSSMQRAATESQRTEEVDGAAHGATAGRGGTPPKWPPLLGGRPKGRAGRSRRPAGRPGPARVEAQCAAAMWSVLGGVLLAVVALPAPGRAQDKPLREYNDPD